MLKADLARQCEKEVVGRVMRPEAAGKDMSLEAELQTRSLPLDRLAGEYKVDPRKVLRVLLSKNADIGGVFESRKKALMEKIGTSDPEDSRVEHIVGTELGLTVLEAICVALEKRGQPVTLNGIARVLGVENNAIRSDVAGQSLKVERVSAFDDAFRRVVLFEEGKGEDAVTMQGVIDSGELYAVRDEEGAIKGVLGLVYGSGGEVVIHRLHVVDNSYGIGVSNMLMEKAIKVAEASRKKTIRVAVDLGDETLIRAYNYYGFRKSVTYSGFFDGSSDMALLELDLEGAKQKRPAQVAAEDVPCRDIDGEPLTLGGKGGRRTIWAVKSPETIARIAELGRITYPCPEGPDTLRMFASIGGLYCVKDEQGKVEAAVEVFYTKDKDEIVFHGAPVTEDAKREKVDVELIRDIERIVKAKRMVCRSFPMETAPKLKNAMNVMLESGGRLSGSFEERPSPDLSYQSHHPEVVWEFKRQPAAKRKGRLFRSFVDGVKAGTTAEVRKLFDDELTVGEKTAAAAGAMLPIGVSLASVALGVVVAATTNLDLSGPQTAMSVASTAVGLPGAYVWGKSLVRTAMRLAGVGLGQYCG